MLLYGKTEIKSVAYDSRNAEPGGCFVCMRGANTDGHFFAQSAYDRGCRVFVCEEDLPLPDDALQFIRPDTRIELAEISAEFFGRPADKLKIIGVTGTKGKTTVSSLTADMLNRCGKKAGVIGTNGIVVDGERTPTANTTPESYELHRAFAQMVDAGCEYAVMEVSSQSVKLERVHGIEYEIGVFTNLSPDHIGEGEHKDFSEYRECKTALPSRSKAFIYNADDPHGAYMAGFFKGTPLTFSVKNRADYYAEDISMWQGNNALGVTFNCIHGEKSCRVTTSTPGDFSVENALAVIAVCSLAGADVETVAKNIAKGRVAGRFELVDALPDITCIIDYAHNELSMKSTLSTLRIYNPRRLVVLFGSVGGRTQGRRAALGKVAGKFADFCILTSDNPAAEDPMQIIKDIESGMGNCPHIAIPDRKEAIEYAIKNARDGDVILFAGKGHEEYQLIGNKKMPFSEREIILNAAKSPALR